MDDRELYKETFAQVRTSVKIDIDDFKRKEHRKSINKIIILAAAVCLLAALGITAYATDFFSLRSVVMAAPSQQSAESETDGMTPAADKTDSWFAPSGDVMSLQGYTDSPASMAMTEWFEFLQGYDTDGALLAEVGNDPTGLDSKYDLYFVYTQEMADKLDEITAKYGLELHTKLDILTHDELVSRVGGEFFGTGHAKYDGYMYEDGTLHEDGDYYSADGVMPYQLMRCVEGSFTDVTLGIGSVSDYEEWSYTTSDGTDLTLAVSADKSLVIAELDGAMVTVNILAGTAPGGDFIVTRDIMESFADSINWQVLNVEV